MCDSVLRLRIPKIPPSIAADDPIVQHPLWKEIESATLMQYPGTGFKPFEKQNWPSKIRLYYSELDNEYKVFFLDCQSYTEWRSLLKKVRGPEPYLFTFTKLVSTLAVV